MYKFFFKHFVKSPTLLSYNSFLFIGPHPDDIELGCGAFVSRLVRAGRKVRFLICTDGRFGNSNLQHLSEQEIISRRELEAASGAGILGVSDIIFLTRPNSGTSAALPGSDGGTAPPVLTFSDGGFYSEDDMRYSIANAISQAQPDVVFITDPDTFSECHPDHLRIGRIVKEIAQISTNKGIMAKYGAVQTNVKAVSFYFTSHPNQKFLPSRDDFQRKINAILAHSSQYPQDAQLTQNVVRYLKIRRLFRVEESFRVLDRTHMHCMPEADF